MLKWILLLFPLMTFAEEEMDVAKVSEAMGHMIGKNLDALGLDFDIEAIVKGLKQENEGKASPLNEDECVQAIATLQDEKMAMTQDAELKSADAISNGSELVASFSSRADPCASFGIQHTISTS